MYSITPEDCNGKHPWMNFGVNAGGAIPLCADKVILISISIPTVLCFLHIQVTR